MIDFGLCPHCDQPITVVGNGDEASMHLDGNELIITAIHHCPKPLNFFTCEVKFVTPPDESKP